MANRKKEVAKVFLITLAIISISMVANYIFEGTHRKLSSQLNKVNLDSSYSKLKDMCYNIELEDVCSSNYYTKNDINTSNEKIIAKLKSIGYTVYPLKDRFDGMASKAAYIAINNSSGTFITYKELDRGNQDYGRSSGNVQFVIYGMPKGYDPLEKFNVDKSKTL